MPGSGSAKAGRTSQSFTRPGRGGQMNAAPGSRAASALFLADSTLRFQPFQSDDVRDVAGGWFGSRRRPSLAGAAHRASGRLAGPPLQAPLRRSGSLRPAADVSRLGGYRDIALMEDVGSSAGWSRKARRRFRRPITTSARRWRRDGWFRRSARNLRLLTLYFCGVPPRVLAGGIGFGLRLWALGSGLWALAGRKPGRAEPSRYFTSRQFARLQIARAKH